MASSSVLPEVMRCADEGPPSSPEVDSGMRTMPTPGMIENGYSPLRCGAPRNLSTSTVRRRFSPSGTLRSRMTLSVTNSSSEYRVIGPISSARSAVMIEVTPMDRSAWTMRKSSWRSTSGSGRWPKTALTESMATRLAPTWRTACSSRASSAPRSNEPATSTPGWSGLGEAST